MNRKISPLPFAAIWHNKQCNPVYYTKPYQCQHTFGETTILNGKRDAILYSTSKNF